jgi:hypothetical protein
VVSEHLVLLVTTPEGVNALRNLVLSGKGLANINTCVAVDVCLGERMASQDERRWLAAAVSIMEVGGRELAEEGST